MSATIFIPADQESIVFKEYFSLTEAEMAKSILDNTNIWSMINNEYMSMISPPGVIPAQLIIRRDDLEKAKALIDG